MIKSKKDYHFYIAQDKIALGIKEINPIKNFFQPNYIYNFQKKLRRLEFYNNCKKGVLNKLIYYWLRQQFSRYSLKLGLSIPLNVFGPGLAIVHYGTIVVSNRASIGKNCRIHPNVSIGESGGNSGAPVIGDNVYIGPGAKIFGSISIASNTAISANATVFKSFKEEHIMIAGNPAKKIKDIEISSIIKHVKS